MRLLYTKPKLKDLSQGSRIAFVRQFRHLSQDAVSAELGLHDDNRRRIMTRYEKGGRTPKEYRVRELMKILNVNYEAIKKYDYREPIDMIYTLMWLEELIPNYYIDISDVPNLPDKNILIIRQCLNEWDVMRTKRLKREISYEEYIEWKLHYQIKGVK